MGKSRANGGVARSRTAASPVPMATYPAAPRSPAAAVIAGGLLVGALDGLYAVIASLIRGTDPSRVFMGVASGLLGREAAFGGGATTVALGVLLHFTVATLIVLTYYLLSRPILVLRQHPIPSGALFGLVAYAVMNMVVIPLSAIDRSPLAFRPALAGAIVHVLLVGIPAALVVRSAGNQRLA